MEEPLSCLKKRIDGLLTEGRQVIVAIEGSCASGKTTLAAALEAEYACNIFHMDDFFLRPEQRTPARYAQPGGNVDYERFREEVLLPLKQGGTFSYRPFSCTTFTLGEPVAVRPKQLTIVEGTYSLHPYFGEVYDLKIVLAVEEEVQRQRILQRPAFLHRRFFEEWIPMEAAYFSYFRIPEQGDLLMKL